MEKITDLSELRLIQMDILSYVDKVCRENGIKYSLAGGTLIGAVRHMGYIPWDVSLRWSTSIRAIDEHLPLHQKGKKL